MSIAHSTGRARSGEVSIFYRKLGNRALTPILIVHGLSYFSWDWLEVGQVLAAEREVVAMDMRGFGEGNFKALFESMELDQVRRGVLKPAA